MPALPAVPSAPGEATVQQGPWHELLEGHWYDAVASLLDRALPRADAVHRPRLTRARDLAVAARRVLDLDAEDFGVLAPAFDSAWSPRLAASAFPLAPRDPQRGALGSLVPLYELMLEVVQLRAVRREPLQIVVTAHLLGEYLAQLAWETTLGHAGDPLRMAALVGGSRWGTDDPACPHPSSLRSTARRSLNACSGDVAAYTAYLDRFHSRLGDALAVCAMNHAGAPAGGRPDVGASCPNPCDFAVRRPLAERLDLDARVRLALLYVDSPIVALRHHAPVGHFFGVPSVREISEAWLRTWDRVTQPWPDGANPLLLSPPAGRPDEPLPGLGDLVSAVAGRPVVAGRLVRDIGDEVARTLGGSTSVAEPGSDGQSSAATRSGGPAGGPHG